MGTMAGAGSVSLVRAEPVTGRTHQIRRHLFGAGHGIVGDDRYYVPGERYTGSGLFLCAYGLAFEHPLNAHVQIQLEAEPSKNSERCPLYTNLNSSNASAYLRTNDCALPPFSYRIPGFLFLSLAYTLKLGIVHIIHGADRHRIHRILIEFIHRVYALMGIRVFVQGELPEEPSILMGNHRSYVDAVMIPAKTPVVFVGRVESKSWPIIGWGATLWEPFGSTAKAKKAGRKPASP